MDKVEVDTRSVLAMFNELDERRRKQVYKGALNSSANILIRQTRINLRSVVKSTKTRNYWNGKTLENGMRKYMFKDNKGITVAIGGKDKRIDFRLKFFEMGTEEREIKYFVQKQIKNKKRKRKKSSNPKYRGKIKAGYFFKNAKEQTESKIFGEMESTLTKYIQRINDKYKNK